MVVSLGSSSKRGFVIENTQSFLLGAEHVKVTQVMAYQIIQTGTPPAWFSHTLRSLPPE